MRARPGIYKSSESCYKNTTDRRGCLPNRVALIRQPPSAGIMSDPKPPPTQTAGNPMGQSIALHPAQVAPPIPDTSPQALGLDDDSERLLESSTSGLRRVMEKTVDKLGRTRSLSSKSPSKRIFSLGRNRGKDPGPSGAILIPSSPPVPTSRRLQIMRRQRPRLGAVIHLTTLPFSTRLPLSPPSARR